MIAFILLQTVEKGMTFEKVWNNLLDKGTDLGLTLIKAAVVFIVGRFVVNLLNKLVRRLMERRNVELSVKTFVMSLVNILLMILLIVSVVGTLGIETTSFAALLASAGVAVGMALSGNLSNFAGGLIILVFKPYKVGDYIEAQGVGGTVKAIQIFHTVLSTVDNKLIYIPNGAMSSDVVVNFSTSEKRRIEWVFGVDYGSDYAKVKKTLEDVLAKEKRILMEPAAPFIGLKELADSSVNFVVRAWVNNGDYWNVFFDINKEVYETFNQAGIEFPFPQVTVHQAPN